MRGPSPGASGSDVDAATARALESACRTAEVFVVLSTYNGALYVAEQIESIRRQSLHNWCLVVRDDASTDETRTIVSTIASSDARIILLPADGRNLGAPDSFGALLTLVHGFAARYVFLADQDDVWREDKLARQLAALRMRETAVGDDVPLLVHSDLEVVDRTLRTIHPSFKAFQNLEADDDAPLRTLLVHNVVTGCASLVNRALLDVALPMPAVGMHDWWLAQCAAAFGELHFTPEPLVRYRQHGGNVVGAQGPGRRLTVLLGQPVSWWSRSRRIFLAGVGQAHELERRLAGVDSSAARHARLVVQTYCAVYEDRIGAPRRMARVLRSRVRPLAATRRLIFYARVASYARWLRAASSAR